MKNIDIDFKLIGERIKKERIKNGYGQNKLAKELNVSDTYINKIENGCEISLKNLAKISQVLEIEIEELIVGTVFNNSNYLEKDLHQILLKCTPLERNFIYNVARIVAESHFLSTNK